MFRERFHRKLKKDMKTYDQFPGHGANLMDLFDLFTNDKPKNEDKNEPPYIDFIEGVE